MATVNTDNILFICGGAFPDLETIIKERLSKATSMGFGAQLKDSVDGAENCTAPGDKRGFAGIWHDSGVFRASACGSDSG